MSLDITLPTINDEYSSHQSHSIPSHSSNNRSTKHPPTTQSRTGIERFFKAPRRRKDKYAVERSHNSEAEEYSSPPPSTSYNIPSIRETMVGFRNVNIPHPRVMRERFQPEGTSGALLSGWILSALLAVIIPVSKWSAERNRYHNYYGKYNEYEQQQQQYENGNYNNNGNNNNGNYNGNNGNYNGYNLCSWYDIRCKYRMRRFQQMYGNGNGGGGGGENQQMAAMLPGWYFFFGGSVEQDDREREEMGMTSNEGSMKFVYFCTIIMFIGMAIFGFRSMYAGKDRAGLIAALLIFGQFSLMNLLTTVQGTVETDNRFFENSVYGWFGQWSVLVAYTDFWLMLHCFVFAGFLGVLRCLDKKANRDVVAENQEVESMGYHKEEDTVITERQQSFNAAHAAYAQQSYTAA